MSVRKMIVTHEEYRELDASLIVSASDITIKGENMLKVMLEEPVDPAQEEDLLSLCVEGDTWSSLWQELVGEQLGELEAHDKLVEVHPLMPQSEFRDRLDTLILEREELHDGYEAEMAIVKEAEIAASEYPGGDQDVYAAAEVTPARLECLNCVSKNTIACSSCWFNAPEKVAAAPIEIDYGTDLEEAILDEYEQDQYDVCHFAEVNLAEYLSEPEWKNSPVLKGTIHDWEIFDRFVSGGSWSADRYIKSIRGHIYGHETLDAGYNIMTSAIVSIEGDLAHTMSGSLYRLGDPKKPLVMPDQSIEVAILEECEVAAVRQSYVDEYFVGESIDADLFYQKKEKEMLKVIDDSVDPVVVYDFAELKPVQDMTIAELDAELRDRMVPGRSIGRKSAKQALLLRARQEQDEETQELTSEEVEAVADHLQAQYDKGPPAEAEIPDLEAMSNQWWPAGAVADRIGVLRDPARKDGKEYVFAPSLCAFVFKLGEKIFSQKSFNPQSWMGRGWMVKLAIVDERTGKPDLSLVS